MSIKRYAAKRDENEPVIIEVLEQLGAIVFQLSDHKLPDLLVRFDDAWWLIEVKNPNGRNRLTDGQRDFIAHVGADAVIIVRNTDDVIAWINTLIRD